MSTDRGREGSSTDLVQFRDRFWRAFASLGAESAKYKELRADLELASDILAGPMHSICAGGECDYVFADTEGRFPGVKDTDTFARWCTEVVGSFREVVESVRPVTDEEHSDRLRLLQIAEEMQALAQLAARIVAVRGLRAVR